MQHERQQATLQLTRAIPSAPIPLQHLFKVVRLHDASQVEGFYRRIRPVIIEKDGDDEGKDGDGGDVVTNEDSADEGCTRWICSIYIDTFDADPEIVLNILELVKDVDTLGICVGPAFIPTHLQAALAKPRRTLKSLEIRFRSGTDISSNESLAESYYDAALLGLARWPAPSSLAISNDGNVGLRSLSLIQEPVHSAMSSRHLGVDELEDVDGIVITSGNIWQPAVLFSFQPLSELLASPAMSALLSLTVRLPGRGVVPSLFNTSSVPSQLSASWFCAATNIRYLDLSTTRPSRSQLWATLAYIPRLTHLILEDTNLILIGEAENTERGLSWRSLGRLCAMPGRGGAVAFGMCANLWLRDAKVREDAKMREDLDALKVSVNETKDEVARIKEGLHSIKERWYAVAPELDTSGARISSTDDRSNGTEDSGEGKRSIDGGEIGARQEKEERGKQNGEGVGAQVSSSSTSSSERIHPPSTIFSKFGKSNETNVHIVPFPPTLRSLRVSHPCDVRGSEYNGDEFPRNERAEHEETARRMFEVGWGEGISGLRSAWRSFQEKMPTWSASSSEVALMFGHILSDGGDELEQEGALQETELVLATKEALESLLVREFVCPKLYFTGGNTNTR